jgi:hypothetical protein
LIEWQGFRFGGFMNPPIYEISSTRLFVAFENSSNCNLNGNGSTQEFWVWGTTPPMESFDVQYAGRVERQNLNFDTNTLYLLRRPRVITPEEEASYRSLFGNDYLIRWYFDQAFQVFYLWELFHDRYDLQYEVSDIYGIDKAVPLLRTRAYDDGLGCAMSDVPNLVNFYQRPLWTDRSALLPSWVYDPYLATHTDYSPVVVDGYGVDAEADVDQQIVRFTNLDRYGYADENDLGAPVLQEEWVWLWVATTGDSLFHTNAFVECNLSNFVLKDDAGWRVGVI